MLHEFSTWSVTRDRGKRLVDRTVTVLVIVIGQVADDFAHRVMSLPNGLWWPEHERDEHVADEPATVVVRGGRRRRTGGKSRAVTTFRRDTARHQNVAPVASAGAFAVTAMMALLAASSA